MIDISLLIAMLIGGLGTGFWLGATLRDKAWSNNALEPVGMEYNGKIYNVEIVENLIDKQN